jgi:hypothetical protein
MPSSTIHFTPEFIKQCEQIWRDGYNKGTNSEDILPDFKTFFSQSKIKTDTSFAELEKLPFNPLKCEARVEKYGYAIQCTRSPFGGGCLCKTHQNMLNKLPEGKDIRYGRFNQPRPDVTLDTGDPIKWGPKKTRSKGDSVKPHPKLKVGEMRDFLSSRIPNTVFKGMKKKELTELYLNELEKDKSQSSSSEEENANTPHSSPENSPKSEQSEEKPEEQSEEQSEEKPEEKPEEQSEEKPEEQSEEQSEKNLSQIEDDGKGTGLLSLIPEKPNTVSEYKELFDKIGIDYSNLRGSRAYKQAYEDHLKAQEEAETEEKTEPLSDDDDDLQEDTNKYDETNFEGVDYLEDEDTAKVYNLKGQYVGKWNEDTDDIIWVSEDFKIAHENARP